MYKLHNNTKVVSIGLSVLSAVFAVSLIAYAATSIGTNLSVDGTATVTGNSTLSGTLSVTGASTFTGAITANGNGTFGDANTDIYLFTGRLQASTTALFTSGLTAYGNIITSAASVGVSTSTPTQTLSVHGSSYVSGTSFFGDTLTATSSAVLARDGGTVGVASSTPSKLLSVGGNAIFGSAATTTLTVTTSSNTLGGCIGLRTVDGTNLRIYATSSTQVGTMGGLSNLKVEAGLCQ